MAQPDRGPERTKLADICKETQRERYSDDEFHAIEEIAICVVNQFFPDADVDNEDFEITDEQANRGMKDMSDAAKRVAPNDPDRRRLLMSEGATLAFAIFGEEQIDELDDQLQFTLSL